MGKNIFGLYVGSKWSWDWDFRHSEFWHPEKYGITIDKYDPNTTKTNKYKFAMIDECWENQDLLRHLRKKGIKIFLFSKEPIATKSSDHSFFHFEKFKNNYGAYYFCPDIVFAAGSSYAKFWEDKTIVEIVGYPRFEQYLSLKRLDKEKIKKRFGIGENKKVIFFPAFYPVLNKEIGASNHLMIFPELLEVVSGLEEIAKDDNVQVVIKIHPHHTKYHNKVREGKRKRMEGDFLQDYSNDRVILIEDDNFRGRYVKDLLFASDLVIGCGTSTTILEAALLKKSIINILPGRVAEDKDNFWEDIDKEILTVYNKEDLISSIKLDIKPIENKKIIEKYFGSVDGKFCERVCNIIKKEFDKK